jgi:hypothetical protein
MKLMFTYLRNKPDNGNIYSAVQVDCWLILNVVLSLSNISGRAISGKGQRAMMTKYGSKSRMTMGLNLHLNKHEPTKVKLALGIKLTLLGCMKDEVDYLKQKAYS